VSSFLKGNPFGQIAQVGNYLDENHVDCTETRQSLREQFEEFYDTGQYAECPYSSLLSAVVTEKEWYLDKSLGDHALGRTFKSVPALRPVRFLVMFEGWYVDVPTEILCESGLYGLWSTDYLKDRLAVFNSFADMDAVQQLDQHATWTVLDRILGRPSRFATGIAGWREY